MAEAGPSQATRPFRPELLRFHEGRWELLGGRCRACGAWYFPAPRVCARCSQGEIESVPLSGRGTVYTYTVVYQSTPEFPTPYTLVYVDFPEGVRILGQLVRCPPEAVRIGMPVEAVFEEEDRGGQKVVVWRFRPAAVQEGRS